MDCLKKIITNYVKEYVKWDVEAKKFMNYYCPDLLERYEWFDTEDFEREHELHHSFLNMIPDSYIEIIVDDFLLLYNQNKPY